MRAEPFNPVRPSFQMSGDSLLFFGNHVKETADFLLVYGLTNIETLGLVHVSLVAYLNLYLDIARVFVIQSLNVEGASLFKRSIAQIRFVGVFYLFGHAGDDTPEHACSFGLGFKVPSYNGLFQCRGAGIVT